MDGKTCDLLVPEDTSGHYIWLVWDFKDSLIASFKIYSVISWRQDYRHMSLMSLGLAVKTRLRPQRNSSERSFQNTKKKDACNWSQEEGILNVTKSCECPNNKTGSIIAFSYQPSELALPSPLASLWDWSYQKLIKILFLNSLTIILMQFPKII